MDSLGFFTAWGHPQWNIEAWEPDWYGGEYGYIQLGNYNNAPWFGSEAEGITSYFGNITDWSLESEYKGEVLNLVFRGTAILNQYNTGEYNHWNHTPMSPVAISFEMGFNGIPDEGYIGGEPDYFTVTIPEPATMSLLPIGALALIRRK